MKAKRNLILSLALLSVGSLCAGFALQAENVKVKAQDTNYFRMVSGASVRMEEDGTCSGIRFCAELSTDYLAGKVNLETVSYTTEGTYFGMIIVPEAYLYDDSFGFYNQSSYADMHDYFENKLGKLIDIKYDGADDIYVDDGNYYLRGSVNKIFLHNYNLDYVGVGYWFDGTSYTYASPATAAYEGRNITYVASAALNDFSAEKTEKHPYQTSDNLGGTVYSPYEPQERETLLNIVKNGLLAAQGVRFDGETYVYNSATYGTLDEVVSANENLTTTLSFNTATVQYGYEGKVAPLSHDEPVKVEKKLVSANENIVKVTEDGKLEYVSAGETTVTVYALGNKIKDVCTVKVANEPLMIENYYPEFFNENNVDIINGEYEVVENTNYNVVGGKLIKLTSSNQQVVFKTPVLLGRKADTSVSFGFWSYADAEIGNLSASQGGAVMSSAKTWTITNWNVYFLSAWGCTETDGYGNIYLKSFPVTLSISAGKTANVYVGGFFLSKSVADDCVITLEEYDANPSTDGETPYTLPACTTGETTVIVYDVTASKNVEVTNGTFVPTPNHQYEATYTLTTVYKTITQKIALTFKSAYTPSFVSVPTTAIVENGTSMQQWVNANIPTATNSATVSYKVSIYHVGGQDTTSNYGGGKDIWTDVETRTFSADWTYVFEWTAQNEYGTVSCRQNVYVVESGARSFSCEGATISGNATIVNLGTERNPYYAIKITGDATIEFAQSITSDASNNLAIGVANKGTGTLKLNTWNAKDTTVFQYQLFSEAIVVKVGANRGDQNYISDGKLTLKFSFENSSGDNEIYIEFFQLGAGEIQD